MFSFYHGTGELKVIGFLETFKNLFYYKIILITPGIIWSLKFTAKGQKHNFVELLIAVIEYVYHVMNKYV